MTNPARETPLRRRLWIAGLAAVLATAYCVFAFLHLTQVNTDVGKHDQAAYLEYAREMSTSDHASIGGRNRMPVFPFLASLVYEENLPLEDFFLRVKRMNLLLSLVVLAGVYGLLRRGLPGFEATTLFLIVTFTVFVYRAGYAQAEVLFYGLFFGAFLLLASQLHRPSWVGALLAGTLAGLAHLTKASVLPLLLAFVFWGLAEALVRPGLRAKRALSCGLAVFAFLLTLLPYMLNSKEHFGSYLYNANSTYYAWFDSWDDAMEMERAVGGHATWRNLPADQIPGPAKYFREHGVGDVFGRLVEGLQRPILKSIRKPFGYGKFMVLYFVVFFAVVYRRRRELRSLLAESGATLPAAFAATSVLGYLAVYCFYSPIASGSRLVLAIYLPAMFGVFWFLCRPSIRSEPLWQRGDLELRMAHLHFAALLVLGLDLVFHVPKIITKVYAGG